jgi:hypothetical protein
MPRLNWSILRQKVELKRVPMPSRRYKQFERHNYVGPSLSQGSATVEILGL